MGNAHEQGEKAGQQQAAGGGHDAAAHAAGAGAGHGAAQSKAAWDEYVCSVDGENASHPEEPAAPAGPPEVKKEAVLDLNGLVTPGLIGSVLSGIANEPGERGRLAIEIKVEGKVPVGPVSAMGGAWAELQIMYYLNDQNFQVMEIDVAGAARAGIDVGGFFSVGAEVGYETDFLNCWFKGTAPAAQWIFEQLKKLDDFAGGGLISFGEDKPKKDGGHGDGHGGGDEGPEFQLHDSAVFAGVFAEAEVGEAFKRDTSYTGKKVKRTFHDREHHAIESHEDHRILDAGFEVKLGRFSFGARYNRDWSDTTGSPIYYSNGIFVDHDLTLTAGIKELFPKHFGKQVGGLPTKPVQDLVVNLFAMLEKLAGPFKFAGELNAKLFTKVVEELYHVHKAGKIGVNVLCDLIFNWNTYGEVTNENKLMYFRVKVQPRAEVEVGLDSPVGGVEGGVTASKSEVVYERIGSETVSYIQRQFIYATDDRPWPDFVSKNQEQIDALVANCADPEFLYYEASVAKAYGTEKNATAGLRALERHWRKQDKQTKKVGKDAAKIGRELEEGTSMMTWFQSTKDAHMGTIYQVLLKYAQDPKLMKFFFSQLPAYAVDLDELEAFANKANHGNVYRRLKAIAARG